MLCRSAVRAGRVGLLAIGLLGFSAPGLAAEVKITDAARKHFNAGVALLKDPDGARYEEAYGEFKVAYQASPSWKILGNLGITAMKLERDGEAIEAFSRYLEEGGKNIDAGERADIERDLSTLRASAVNVLLTTTPAEVAVTDERTPSQGSPVRNRYQSQGGSLRLQIRPGHHVMTATLDGKPTLRFEFDAQPGGSEQHEFNFDAAAAMPVAAPAPAPPVVAASPPPAPAAARPVPAAVWVGVAATGLFAVGASVTGVMALGKNSDYQAANGHDAARAKSLQSDTKTLNLITDGLIAASVVSAGVTTFLYLRRPARDEGGVALRLRPSFGLERAHLSIEGAFQ
jgi:hypothetical protein